METLLARDGRCLVCGTFLDGDTINPHHIQTRGAGGADTPENGMALCTWCHDDVHRGHTTIDGETIPLTAEVLRWLLVLHYGYEYEPHELGDDLDRLIAECLFNRTMHRPKRGWF